MDEQSTSLKGKEALATSRAATISVADFSEALSLGVLRALEQRPGSKFRPWIWFGGWFGDGPWGPNGPFGPGGIPFDQKGSG